MATPEEEKLENIKKARIEFAAYKREFEELSGKKFPDPFEGMKIDQIIKKYGSIEKAMDAIRLATKGVRSELNEMGNSLDTIRGIVNGIGEELQAIQNPLNAAKNAYRKIRGVVSDIEMMQADISSYDKSQIASTRKKNKEAFLTLQIKKKELEAERDKEQQRLNAEAGEYSAAQLRAGFGGKELKLRQLKIDQLTESILLAEDDVKLQKDINEQLDIQERRIGRINDGMGITGGLIKGIGKAAEKIGFGGFGEKVQKISDGLKGMSYEMTEGGNRALSTAEKARIMGAGIGGVFKELGNSLKDPLVQLTLATAMFKQLAHIGEHASQVATDLARNLGMTSDNSLKAYKNIFKYSQELDSAFTNSEHLIKANQELNEALGTSVVFSKEQLEIQSLLTNQLGLSGEEAANAAKFAAMQGKSGEQIVDGILAQGDGLINNRELVQEVLSVSADTAALYDNNPTLIAKAVMETKKLGMSLQQAKNIAGGLLDFESSIDAEMEAQLLTGRNINLARARELSLQGKTAEAAAEARRQIGSYTDFMNQGPLAQEALAKAMGMSTDELAEQLRTTELIDQIRKKNPGLTQEQLNTEALRQTLSASERLSQSMTTLKESFASIIKGPLTGFMDGLSNIFKTLAESKLGKIITGFAGVAMTAGAIFLALKAVVGGITKTILGKRGDSPARPMFVQMSQGMGQGLRGDYSGGGAGGGYIPGESRGRRRDPGRRPDKATQKRYQQRYGRRAANRRFKPTTRRRGRGLGGALATGLSFLAPELAYSMTGTDMGPVGDVGTQVAADSAAQAGGGMFSKLGDKLKNTKLGKGLSSAKSFIGEKASKLNPMKLVDKIKKYIPTVGSKFGSFAKKIPVLGTAIEGLLTTMDVKSMVAEGGEKEDIYQDIGRRVLQGVGGIMGGLGASAITTGLSATGIPAFLLNGIAYTLGDMAGRYVFGQLADVVGARPIGEAISKTFGLEDDIAAANKQQPQKQTIKANDFTIKTNPADTLVMAGGTQFGQETNDLLRELVTAVKQGGTVYIDGDKAGRAIMMGSYKTA